MKVGERWWDDQHHIWTILKIDTLIECTGARGVIEFFDPVTLRTTSRFEPNRRLVGAFKDEHRPPVTKSEPMK